MWQNIETSEKITEKRKKYLVSKQNFHTVKSFSENLLAIAMKSKNTDTHKLTSLLRFIDIRIKQNSIEWVSLKRNMKKKKK